MKKITTIAGLLMVSALPSFGQATVTLPMTDIASAEICSGASVTITASAATKGNALNLDGSTGTVLVPNSGSVSLSGSGNFTISCWIYPRSNDLQSILYHGLGCSTWGSWGLGIGGTESADAAWSKKLAFYFRTSNGSASKSVVSTDTLALNHWVHAAVTYDGSNLRLYINGVLDRTSVVTGTPWNSTEKLSMGSDPGCGGRNFYNGKLDEVQIWNKTRSASEIAASYDKISPPTIANLTAYWRFDENNGNYVYDVSTNKNIGTINTSVSREIPSTAPLPTMSSTTTTFVWRPATGLSTATGAIVMASPTTTTDYTVTATNTATGDTNTNIVRINVNPRAATPGVTTPVTYCQGYTASSLTATKGSTADTLLWYTTATGGTGSKTAPSPATTMPGSTLYYVSSTSFNCESGRDSIRVNVNPAPMVSISSLSPTGTIYCRNEGGLLLKATAPTTTSYQWYYKDTLLTAATYDTISVRKTGYWYVEVKNANGCRNKDSIWIDQDTLAAIALTPSVNKICVDGSLLLTCHPGYVTSTFEWYRNSVFMGISATSHITLISDTGTYYVVMTNVSGCRYTSNNARVNYYPPTPKPSLVYDAPILSVTGGRYISYQWYLSGKRIVGAIKSMHPVSSNGRYWVEVTDANGCTSLSDTLEIELPNGIPWQNLDMVLRLYPNPTPSLVMIEAPVNVTVTDVVGKSLLGVKNVRAVDLSNFADGTYFFRITDEDNRLLGVKKVQKIAR